MVFAANGGLVIEARALGARFTHAERRAEGPAYLARLAGAGLKDVTEPVHDPRFYHLDTALAVLDDDTIAYYPTAFSEASRARLQELFPDAIEVASADAYVLGLNAVSDGLHVVHPAAAVGFAAQLAGRGYEPVGVDLGELLKAGGSVECCTLEIRACGVTPRGSGPTGRAQRRRSAGTCRRRSRRRP
jgi:N-dimethylarginine dimethylaminohydrolase